MDVVVAIKRSDVGSVKKLIEETPSLVNCTEDSFGQTLLHLTCQTISDSNKEILSYLLSKGATPTLQDDSGNTPLHSCCESGDTGEYAELLVKYGADINTANKSQIYPIHIACRGLNFSLVQFLVNNGALLNVQAKRVVNSVDMNDFSLRLKSLMPFSQDNLPNLGIRTEELGPTPLHYAANATKCILSSKNIEQERTKIVKKLIESGANVNIVDNSTTLTPLLAVIRNCEDNQFQTENENDNIINYFVGAGANLEYMEGEGDTALMLASLRNLIHAVDVLLKLGANIDTINPKGRTALHVASGQGNASIVQYLLEKDANTDIVDKFGSLPIHEAATFGHTEVVRKLVLLGKSDVNAKSIAYQSTPLHLASQNGNIEMIDFLLQHGAHLLATNSEGETSAKVAANQETSDFLSGHIQVCFLQERIISIPFFETEKVTADIESNAKRLYGPSVHVNFSPEDLQAEKEILVNVSLPKPKLILKVKKQGDEIHRQIFLGKLSFSELREKVLGKFELKTEEISMIVLLPDIAILDDDDVGTLTTGDVLEIRIK